VPLQDQACICCFQHARSTADCRQTSHASDALRTPHAADFISLQANKPAAVQGRLMLAEDSYPGEGLSNVETVHVKQMLVVHALPEIAKREASARSVLRAGPACIACCA